MNLNRRQFLKTAAWGTGALGVTALSGSALARWWPEQGLKNPCLSDLPTDPAARDIMARTWDGLDPTQVWDSHAHLVGVGDGGSGIYVNPHMDSLLHPGQYAQKLFFLNAGCAHQAPGRVDQSYVERLHNLSDAMPAGYKLLLLAFDAFVDGAGQPDLSQSTFVTPDAYAQKVAAERPERFAWAASIHPYRPDALARLDWAVKNGAKAIKWLPAAQGMDPASPRCDDFFAALAKYQLPLISHAGREKAVHAEEQQQLGNPLRLRRALDHGVRVVVAHCAGHGLDQDLDQDQDRPPHYPDLPSIQLFARLMAEPRYQGKLFGDISAITQINRLHSLPTVLKQVLVSGEWQGRLLNGSDYPLPGVMPLFSVEKIAALGFLPKSDVAGLQSIRRHHPLLFDLALKRCLRYQGKALPKEIFETRAFFEAKPA